MSETQDAQRVREILADVKPLAAEYYKLTGKPLGVTGEVAEYVAAELLGLTLAPPRTHGYDATRDTPEGKQRIQIKGRAYGEDAKPGQRLGTIKSGSPCDIVMLVLLDNRTLEAREIWEAPIAAVEERLALPGSKARLKGALRVNEFKRLARLIWPVAEKEAKTMTKTVGILAYGSLMANPGDEIKEATVETKTGVTTPFSVEFARSSGGRRGAPTLVPVKDHGIPVQAQILVVNVAEMEAANRLYRREINKVGSGRIYIAPQGKPGVNDVVVRRLENFGGVDVVLYTEIAATINPLTAEELARLAIGSAKGSADGRDGISYLIDAKQYGVKTLLSDAYEEEIKKQMQAGDLHEALRKARLGAEN